MEATRESREAGASALAQERMLRLSRIYDAFARADDDALLAEVVEEFVFHAATGRRIGRTEPYVGAEGLTEYLADARELWLDVRLTPQEYRESLDRMLVRGRVWARDHDGTVLDSPVIWIWTFEGTLPIECDVIEPGEGLPATAPAAGWARVGP